MLVCFSPKIVDSRVLTVIRDRAVFAPGVYREVSITPRPGDVFVGDSPSADAVVLTGARVIATTAVKPAGEGQAGKFVAANRTEKTSSGPGKCDPTHPRCTFPNDLFFDGVPLMHVGIRSHVNRSGTWYFDVAANEIVFFVGSNSVEGQVLGC